MTSRTLLFGGGYGHSTGHDECDNAHSTKKGWVEGQGIGARPEPAEGEPNSIL